MEDQLLEQGTKIDFETWQLKEDGHCYQQGHLLMACSHRLTQGISLDNITYAGEFGGLCFADAQQLLPEAVQCAGLWKCKENILKVKRLWSCHFRFPK